MTLWGERASAFSVDHVFSSDSGKPVVVLLVGGLIKRYQGMFCLYHQSI